MLIEIPDNTPLHQVEYVAAKLGCDLVCSADGPHQLVKQQCADVIDIRAPRQPKPTGDGPYAA